MDTLISLGIAFGLLLTGGSWIYSLFLKKELDMVDATIIGKKEELNNQKTDTKKKKEEYETAYNNYINAPGPK